MLIKHSIPMQRKNIVKDGLVLWLEGEDFTNSPPTSLLRDRSGNGNNATPSGMAYTVSSGSDNNGRIALDGIDDKMTIPYADTMKLGGNDFTLEVTTSIDTLSTFQVLMSRRLMVFTSIEYMFAYENGANNIEFRYTLDGTTLTILKFYFCPVIGVVYDLCLKRVGNNLYLLVNGVQHTTVNTLTGTLFNSTDNLIIGALKIEGGYSSMLYGKSKRILQYNRALTDAEILQNHNASK